MPQNDPYEERRARREQMRRKREQQQRLLRIRLVAAAAAIAVCAGLIFFISRGSQGQEPAALSAPSGAEGASVVTQPPQTEPTEPGPTTVIHIAAGGDMIVCDETVAAGGYNYNYNNAFQDVLPLLAQADLTVLNLEGNIVGEPYGTATRSAPAQLLTALAEAGVDCLQMANSYSITNGLTGLSTSLQAIRNTGLEPLGAYATASEFRRSGGYTIREVRGIRVALVAFTKGMDGMSLPAGSEDCVNLLYTDYDTAYQKVDTERITSVLKSVASEEPDITIALLHWGSEYNDSVSSSMETIEELMRANGVDVIIGSHPHYVQEIQYDDATGAFTCYSLGDFFGPAARAGTDYSILLDLEITRDNETEQTRVTGYTYTPIYTVTSANGYRVVRIESAIAGYELNAIDKVSPEAYEGLQNGLARIQSRVDPDSVQDGEE